MSFFIINILFNLYQYSTVLLPVLTITVFIFIFGKRKGLEISKIRYAKLLIFSIYMWLVIRVTGFGTMYDIGYYEHLIRAEEITLNIFQSNGYMTYLFNVLMLMPFGFILPCIWSNISAIKTLFLGSFFSLLIEMSQLLNHRNTATDDLIMNTVGAIIGYYIYIYLHNKFLKKNPSSFINKMLRRDSQAIKLEVIIYIMGIIISYFFLYNWRGYIKLFMAYFY